MAIELTNAEYLAVTPGQVTAFLRANPQRIRRWSDAGIFGKEAIAPGTGNIRSFTIRDMVAGAIAQRVLDTTRTKTLETLSAEELFEALRTAVPQLLANVDGKAAFAIFYKEAGQHRMSLRIGGSLRSMIKPASVLVDVATIVREAKSFLDNHAHDRIGRQPQKRKAQGSVEVQDG